MVTSSIITVANKLSSEDRNIAELTDYISKIRLRQKHLNVTYEINNYYEQALSRTDPRYLAPVRRWEKNMGFVTPIRWMNSFFILLLHFAFLYSLCVLFAHGGACWKTVVFTFICGCIGGFGVTGGTHRYWTHRAYKAKLPLQVILMLSYSLSGQNTIYEWVRDHRVHHKMSETTADPHDANRGFFFAHVGWLMMKKHPHVIREGRKLDMSDILNDEIVQFHTKYFIVLKILVCFLIPTIVPVFFWGELWDLAVIATTIRYTLNLNFTWSVNSFAHLWGNKPYDVSIMPAENWKVSIFAMGEGWHNYHHTFPWDYKAAELAYFLNISTFFIDCFALIGWAYDLKIASPALIKNVVDRRAPKLM